MMIFKILKIESYPELLSSLLSFLFLDQVSNLCKSNAIICNIAHKSEKQNTLTSLEAILMRNTVFITFSINKGEKSSDGTVEKCTLRKMFFWQDETGKIPKNSLWLYNALSVFWCIIANASTLDEIYIFNFKILKWPLWDKLKKCYLLYYNFNPFIFACTYFLLDILVLQEI